MSDDVSFAQQRRRAFEPLPRDWPTTLAAIRAAEGAREGDVDAQRAERERVAKEAEAWRGLQNSAPDYLASLAGPNPPLFGEPTLIDRLWEDMQAGGGDEG